jgi:hypothetical protein
MAAEQATALAANEADQADVRGAQGGAARERAQTNMPLSEFVRLLEYEAQQVAFALARQRYQIRDRAAARGQRAPARQHQAPADRDGKRRRERRWRRSRRRRQPPR